MENKKKAIISIVVVVLTLLALVIGASYAYFSITATNSFGSKTISASAPEIGSVTLTSDNNTISLNLSAEDMMVSNAKVYCGTIDGTPNVSEFQMAHTTVNGPGFFNCNYTLNVTATGTNNLYTAFQGWNGKTSGQIRLQIANDEYDFNTSNLFPITVNGTIRGASNSKSIPITASMCIYNSHFVDQTSLKNKDITITITATSFTCNMADSQAYYYTLDSNTHTISSPLTSLEGIPFYLKGYGTTGVYDEVCGVFNGTEYCLLPHSFASSSTIRSEMEALGTTCEITEDALSCENDGLSCTITSYGRATCGYSYAYCVINEYGEAFCLN